MVRNLFELFLRARRALEFSHSQDPQPTCKLEYFCSAHCRIPRDALSCIDGLS
jgi:hypothetical protein